MAHPAVRLSGVLLAIGSCAIGCGSNDGAGKPIGNDPAGAAGGPGQSVPSNGGSAAGGSGGTAGANGSGQGGSAAKGGAGPIGSGGTAGTNGAGSGGSGEIAGAGGAGRGGSPAAGGAGSGGSVATGGTGTAGSGGTGGAGGAVGPTIWLAGDSTVQTYLPGNVDGLNGVSIEGWGQELGQFFDARITISNQAIGGRSIAFFMWAVVKDAAGVYQCVDDQGNPLYQLDASGNHVDTSQWARIKSAIKPGDFLLIQFGTNDETHTCPRFVTLPDFESDFGLMADTVRAKGATPIFVTPMGHRSFVGTTVQNTLLPYANAMKDEAMIKSVEVEDLNLRSMEYYMTVGNTYLSTNIFDGGTTHFIAAGAVKMAQLIADEIRRNAGPLAAFLK